MQTLVRLLPLFLPGGRGFMLIATCIGLCTGEGGSVSFQLMRSGAYALFRHNPAQFLLRLRTTSLGSL